MLLWITAVCFPAQAAQITGKDGQTYEGEILGEDSENYFLETKNGLITVAKGSSSGTEAPDQEKVETSEANSKNSIGAYGLDPAQLAARVGEGGVLKTEFDSYARGRYSPQHANLSGENWGTPHEGLRRGIEDEIVFQEALKIGLHKEAIIRKDILDLYKANQTVVPIDPSAFTQQEIESYYTAHSKEFMTPAKFRLLLTSLSGADQAAAKTQHAEIKRNPTGHKAWQGGSWIEEGDHFRIPISEAQHKTVYALRKGQVSELIPADGNFYLFWCLDYKPGKAKSLEQSRARVIHLLIKEKEAGNTAALMGKLKARNAVEESRLFFEEAIKAGTLRDRTLRDYFINIYLQRRSLTLGKAVNILKSRYPIEIMPEYQKKESAQT